jgi:hypothetical protein
LKHIFWNNVIVAGGSLGSILFDARNNNDVDLFLYGLKTPEEANKEIMSICDRMIYSMKCEYIRKQRERNNNNNNGNRKKVAGTDEEEEEEVISLEETKKINNNVFDLTFIRKKNTFNIHHGNTKYQIIFRIYKTPSEVLHGFDIGSSAIGFNGKQLLFTTLSKFSYGYNCNILDTTRRSTTYEDRLKKYFNRGFEIILPNFNIDKCDERMFKKYRIIDICELPFMPFGYKRINNKLQVTNWHKDYSKKTQEFESDYDDNDIEEEYSLFYRNLIQLLGNKFDNISYYQQHNYETIITEPKCFTKARIDYFYDELQTKIMDPSKFPVSMVSNYINVDTLENIFGYRNDENKIEELIQKQKIRTNILMGHLSVHDISPHWITDNPGTQLTSSYNPIMKDPEEWYGEYFIKSD